jgi:protease I
MIEGNRVAILVEGDFGDSEVVEILRAMSDAGARVFMVGGEAGKNYRGERRKVRARADLGVDDVSGADFDVVIVPGGHAPDKMRLNGSMVEFVKKAFDSGRLVAAICRGPQLLISAKVLKGRCVTSWPSIAVDLRNAGAVWVDCPVVRDGNLITSRKAADLPRFNKAIIDTLRTGSGRDERSQTRGYSDLWQGSRVKDGVI